MNITNESFYVNGNLYSVIIFALIVRWSVSLHSYSGEKSPPMFGDYEAQRHWMEITINLPLEEWYFNSSKNDLMYWGLDYPPLTAYHSYINGKIAQFLNPDYVELLSSRGYESYNHKFFMRTTVILTDLVIYFTSIVIFFGTLYKSNHQFGNSTQDEVPDKKSTKEVHESVPFNLKVSYLRQVAFALLYPGLILIDHGHFQYNSISLGLTIAGVWALMEEKYLTCTALFCCAVNYKQMSLYHSLPFFVYILSHCLPTKIQAWSVGFKRLFFVSMTVLVTFGVIWLPFWKERKIFIQVLKRLFPVSRGIFEDKVSNFWCFLNIFVKLNKSLTQLQMTKICISCVIITSAMSLVNLFRKPTIKRLILSLINVSLSFFLFSYQVHEKSILLVSVPVLMYFPLEPFLCFWFTFISTFSMLPLFIKDNLIIPFVALIILSSLVIFANVTFPISKDNTKNVVNIYTFSNSCSVNRLLKLSFFLSLSGCIILFLCILMIKPPNKYPDLWPLLVSIYSFLHFFGFMIYFNYIQVFKLKAFE